MRECTYYDTHRRECCTECGSPLDHCKCERLNEQAHNRLASHDSKMILAIRAELIRAREEFPGNRHQLATLMKEVGELAKEMMEYDLGKNVTTAEVFQETVQVACMAIRVGTEGDENFTYDSFSILGEEIVTL